MKCSIVDKQTPKLCQCMKNWLIANHAKPHIQRQACHRPDHTQHCHMNTQSNGKSAQQQLQLLTAVHTYPMKPLKAQSAQLLSVSASGGSTKPGSFKVLNLAAPQHQFCALFHKLPKRLDLERC